MQAKDVPERPILEFLDSLERPTRAARERGNYIGGEYRKGTTWRGSPYGNAVVGAMPPGTPDKVALAKMAAMIRKGLVDGCACGCRGDFELTEKGRAALADPPQSSKR